MQAAATSFRYPLPPALGANAHGRAAGGRQGVEGQPPFRPPLKGRRAPRRGG